MKITLNAKILRIILLMLMLLLISGSVAGFIFAKSKLQEFATSISQIEADAAAGDGNIEALQQLEGTLEKTRDIKTKVDSIAVPAADYPVVVIQNITDIAAKAGIELTSVSYGDSTETPTTQSTPGTTTTPGVGTTTAPAAEAPQTVSGATKKTINVTTESPVSYDVLMSFLRGIESDDMYMHITKVSMTKETGNLVTTQPFTIEVYVR